MTFTVTIAEIALMVLAVVALAVGIYLLVVLRNANELISNVNKILTDNDDNIGKLLVNAEAVSGNAAHFSGSLRRQFEKNEVLVSSIFQSGADSMLLLNDATSRIRTLIANFNQIVRMANRFLKNIK